MTKAEYHAAFGDYTPEEVKEKVLAKHGNVDRAWHRSAKSKMSLKDFDAQAAEVHLFCLSLSPIAVELQRRFLLPPSDSKDRL